MSTTTLGGRIEARASWDQQAAAMARYVRSTRNREKRSYAEHYAGYLLGMITEPDRSIYDLSYMGAQAVRLALYEMAQGPR